MPPAGGEQRAGGRVPQARRPVFAGRGEPRAVRAEGERPDAVAVAVADRRLLAGSRVEHREPHPLAVRPGARQPRAVRAHDDGTGLVGSGTSTRQRTRPASSSRSKAVSPTHAATRSPRRVCVTVDMRPALGADRHGRGLAAVQVREAQAGAGQSPDPEPVRGGEQEADSPRRATGSPTELSSSRLCRCRHSQPRRASGAASSWRAASATSWFCSAAPAAARRARYAWYRAACFSSSACRALGVRQVPLLVRFQPFPGHPGQAAEQRDRQEGEQQRDQRPAPARAGQPGGRPHRPRRHLLPLPEALAGPRPAPGRWGSGGAGSFSRQCSVIASRSRGRRGCRRRGRTGSSDVTARSTSRVLSPWNGSCPVRS